MTYRSRRSTKLHRAAHAHHSTPTSAGGSAPPTLQREAFTSSTLPIPTSWAAQLWRRLPALLWQLLWTTVALIVGLSVYGFLVLLLAARLQRVNPQAADVVLYAGFSVPLAAALVVAIVPLADTVLPPWRTQSAIRVQDAAHNRARCYSDRLWAHYRASSPQAGKAAEDAIRRKIFAAANGDARLLEQRKGWYAW